MDVLSPIQLDDFLTQGYLVIENFVSPAACQKLITRMDSILEKKTKSLPNVVFSTHDGTHAESDYFVSSADKIHFFMEPQACDKKGKLKFPVKKCINKVGHGLHMADETFKAFSFDERINKICHQLGFMSVGLLQSMYIFKQPSIGEEVNWHQDSTYLHMKDSDVIGFWFALEDATIDNGCLLAIPSPNITPLNERFIIHNGRPETIKMNYKNWDKSTKKNLEVKQGTLIMLHGRLPHASGPNKSNKSRQAYAIHAIDRSKTYGKDNWLHWPNGQVPGF